MAATEYSPVTTLETSRAKLTIISESQIAIEDRVLYESIQDILASRGGERWRQLDQIDLQTKSGIDIAIAFDGYDQSEPSDFHYSLASITLTDRERNASSYQVKYSAESDGGRYELQELPDDDSIDDNGAAINNVGGPSLASARLLSLLADAHVNTPLQELEEDDFTGAPL